MIKIALVDDHVVLRKSLALLINMLGGFEVTIEAGNGTDFISQLENNIIPDIALLDIAMPVTGGVETATLLQRQYPKLKIIVLTLIKNEHVKLRMIKSGVRAYLFKDCESEQLHIALREVYESGYHFNEHFTIDILQEKPSFYKPPLNAQQRSFLRWAATGLTHREIAEKMQVSQRTVDSYRDTLFKKLDINTRVGLVKYAIKNGFIHL
jgi:two-component system invasion response regulator UvrY